MLSAARGIAVLDLLAGMGPVGMRTVDQTHSLRLGSVHRPLNDLQDQSAVEHNTHRDWDLLVRLCEITVTFSHRTEFSRTTWSGLRARGLGDR